MADDPVWLHLERHPEDYDTFKIGHRYWHTYRALLLLVTHMLYGDDADLLLDEKDILKSIIQTAWLRALYDRIYIARNQYGWKIHTVWKARYKGSQCYARIGCGESWYNLSKHGFLNKIFIFTITHDKN
jgi:hypothetical protein